MEENFKVLMNFQIYVAIKSYPFSFSFLQETPLIEDMRMDILLQDNIEKSETPKLYGLLELYLKQICDGFYTMGFVDVSIEGFSHPYLGRRADQVLLSKDAYELERLVYAPYPDWPPDYENQVQLTEIKYHYKREVLPKLVKQLQGYEHLQEAFKGILGSPGMVIFSRLDYFHRRFVGYLGKDEFRSVRRGYGDSPVFVPLNELKLI